MWAANACDERYDMVGRVVKIWPIGYRRGRILLDASGGTANRLCKDTKQLTVVFSPHTLPLEEELEGRAPGFACLRIKGVDGSTRRAMSRRRIDPMGAGFLAYDVRKFCEILHGRSKEPSDESVEESVVLPLGLLLTIDEVDGGSKIAKELRLLRFGTSGDTRIALRNLDPGQQSLER